MLNPEAGQDASSFNNGVEAMRDAIVSGLEARGFRIVHAGALDALVSIINAKSPPR